MGLLLTSRVAKPLKCCVVETPNRGRMVGGRDQERGGARCGRGGPEGTAPDEFAIRLCNGVSFDKGRQKDELRYVPGGVCVAAK
jgi:hypothetical protein